MRNWLRKRREQRFSPNTQFLKTILVKRRLRKDVKQICKVTNTKELHLYSTSNFTTPIGRNSPASHRRERGVGRAVKCLFAAAGLENLSHGRVRRIPPRIEMRCRNCYSTKSDHEPVSVFFRKIFPEPFQFPIIK